jgi:hypothetical protein
MRSKRRTAIRPGTLLGVLIVGLLAVPSVSVAAPKPPPEAPQDSVIGTGTFLTGIGEAGFDIAATSGPTGESPAGHVIFTFPDFRIEGAVRCLRIISASTAVVGIFVPASGQSAFVGVTDGPTDFIAVFGFAIGDPIRPGDCPGVIPGGDLAVLSGDLVITDAQPLPTTKDECKNDGWRSFGGAFANQGQCVAFVERIPKP